MEKQIAGASYDGSLFESLDLFPIKTKLVHKTRGLGWDTDRAEQALSLYKKWLYLHAEHPNQKLPPSADVEQVWHIHILDIRKYKRDCHRIFGGKFLHHNWPLHEWTLRW